MLKLARASLWTGDSYRKPTDVCYVQPRKNLAGSAIELRGDRFEIALEPRKNWRCNREPSA